MLQWLDLSFDDPAENLACDEALLEWAERENPEQGVLRFWESTKPFVVVGHAGKVAHEVHLDFCERAGVPVLRRVTGGGSVLQGPGCWNYSLVLPMTFDPGLASIHESNHWVMTRNAQVLGNLLRKPVEIQGPSDLAIGDLKISGNAQRRKRRWILFHGTILREMDIELIERTLAMPPKEPEYRRGRTHGDFLLNTASQGSLLREALQGAWGVSGEFTGVPIDAIAALARDKYGSPAWNLRL